MKIMLINPPVLDRFGERLLPVGLDAIRECPSLGIYLIAEVLRCEGHDVVLADLVAQGSHDFSAFEQDLEECHLVGLGGTSMAWPTALALIRGIRDRRPNLPVVCGGVHATLFDRHLVERHGVGFVVRGEGERPIVALCRALEGRLPFSEVPNLSWMDADTGFERNAIAPRLTPEELVSLPTPDYSVIPDQTYAGLTTESSRGCSFDCSFCSSPLRRGWQGVPAEVFADRVEVLLELNRRTTGDVIRVADDEFTLDPQRAMEIAGVLRRRGLAPLLGYNARAADMLHDGLAQNLARFTSGVLIGAECGYDDGLRRIGKGITCRVLEEAAATLERSGISGRARFCFILGLPWESIREVEKTIRFAADLHATYGVCVVLQWYGQIPGSRLWDEARRKQQVHEAMYDDFGFFRNLYLFQTGCQLTLREIREISETAMQLYTVSRIVGGEGPEIEYHFPTAIVTNFPRDIPDTMEAGLGDLRGSTASGNRGYSRT